MTAPTGNLWIDGEHVPAATVHRARRDLRRGLSPLKPGALVRLPTNPLLSVITRSLCADLGLAYALESRALTVGGLEETAIVANDATVRRRSAATPAPLPGVTRIAATSGSDGSAKAVAHTEASIDHQASALQDRLQLGVTDTMLLPIPITHAYGASVVELWARHGVGLAIESVHEASSLPNRLLSMRVSSVDMTPSMLRVLVASAARHQAVADAVGRLQLVNVGGDMLPPAVAEKLYQICGVPALDGYGLTEAGPNVAVNSPTLRRAGTVGKPLTGVTVRAGHDRQLLVRSPGTMAGYVEHGQVQPQPQDGGWLATGDIGAVDPDGYVTVIGRQKQIILIHGVTIAPAEIEDALRTVAGVEDVGVIGRRHPGGNRDHVRAYVQTDHQVSPQDLIQNCSNAAPHHTRPIQVTVVDQLPRTHSGKVDRHALRQEGATCTSAG